MQVWGEPRYTQDLDLTVLAPTETLPETITKLLSRLHPRIDDAIEFAQRNRVLLARTTDGYPVDISFGLPGYEEEVINRAIEYEIGAGLAVFKICSAEDLIIHKAIAGRVQDVRDIEGVIARQGNRLDTTYIYQWLNIFAELLENAEVIQHFERPWRKYYSK